MENSCARFHYRRKSRAILLLAVPMGEPCLLPSARAVSSSPSVLTGPDASSAFKRRMHLAQRGRTDQPDLGRCRFQSDFIRVLILIPWLIELRPTAFAGQRPWYPRILRPRQRAGTAHPGYLALLMRIVLLISHEARVIGGHLMPAGLADISPVEVRGYPINRSIAIA